MTAIILLVLFSHWLGDFVFQTDDMARNKSKSLKWLCIHVAVYTLFLLPFGVGFALINGVAHLGIDFVTSKISSHYYASGKIHKFFVVVGLDQLIHTGLLISTLGYSYPILLHFGG